MNQEAMSIVKRVHGFYSSGGKPGFTQSGSCLYRVCDPYGLEIGRCAVGCLLSNQGVERINRTQRIPGMDFRDFWNAGMSVGKLGMMEVSNFAARELLDAILEAAGVKRKDMYVLVWLQNIHDSVSDLGYQSDDLEPSRVLLVQVLESIIKGEECPDAQVDRTSVKNLREHIHG